VNPTKVGERINFHLGAETRRSGRPDSMQADVPTERSSMAMASVEKSGVDVLLANKRPAARPKDLVDVELLESGEALSESG
jgi:hypothetical protein